MFHPADHPLERGWVGRVDGDRVVHLAAQTLQHFYAGGARAREHAEYRLAEVVFLAPVQHPTSVRVFETEHGFAFANPAAVGGPAATVATPSDADGLVLLPRLAAVIGAEGAIGGFTPFAEWRAPARQPPKDRDFALLLGPLVVTADELAYPLELRVRVDGGERFRVAHDAVDWDALRSFAASGTVLRTGDVLAAPSVAEITGFHTGASLQLEAGPMGVLGATVG